MSISNHSPAQLRRAASVIERIGKLQKKLNQLLGAKAAAPEPKPRKKRRKISAAGIARIRAAQKARWAKVHAAKGK
jgi:hypothetical protein